MSNVNPPQAMITNNMSWHQQTDQHHVRPVEHSPGNLLSLCTWYQDVNYYGWYINHGCCSCVSEGFPIINLGNVKIEILSFQTGSLPQWSDVNGSHSLRKASVIRNWQINYRNSFFCRFFFAEIQCDCPLHHALEFTYSSRQHEPWGPTISQWVYELIIQISWKFLFLFFYSNDPIKSHFCTCHDSWAVMACAKLWLDWIFICFCIN